MRMLPARSLTTQPFTVKKAVAKLRHLSAPLKGLSLSSKLSASDPLTANVLDNFIIEEDRIKCRFGTKLVYTHAAAKPIWCLVPYYGLTDRIAAATNFELRLLDNTLLKNGFGSDDWHWTSFANLSSVKYTVMVNGYDGVWSWDGEAASNDPAPVAVTSLSKGNPATCTVAPADIGKFKDGDIVLIAGAVGTGLVNANGYKTIYNVGTPANTFTLAGVDTSAAAAAQTSGVTADAPGTGMIKEIVTVPDWLPHINVNTFNIVVNHMNRLWFADTTNLSVYYLPIQQKNGMVTELPMGALFKRGGTIRAMHTWTTDGGTGLDDMLCVFSSNGECVIWRGLDPDSDFEIHGIFRFDSPMSKHCIINYGGELHVLISTGFVPMSTLMRAEAENLGLYDKNVYSFFQENSGRFRNYPGWSVTLNPNTGRAVCNIPQGSANQYKQIVRFMPNPAWTTWSGLQSRCWAWTRSVGYIGSDDGRVYQIGPEFLSDHNNMGAANPIRVDVQLAWFAYGSSAIKQFKMILPYTLTDGRPKPFLDFRVDYDKSDPFNQPDVTTADLGAAWDEAVWDVDYWTMSAENWNNWQGIAAIGRVGAPRLVANIIDCEFSVVGFDVLYEEGSVFG